MLSGLVLATWLLFQEKVRAPRWLTRRVITRFLAHPRCCECCAGSACSSFSIRCNPAKADILMRNVFLQGSSPHVKSTNFLATRVLPVDGYKVRNSLFLSVRFFLLRSMRGARVGLIEHLLSAIAPHASSRCRERARERRRSPHARGGAFNSHWALSWGVLSFCARPNTKPWKVLASI